MSEPDMASLQAFQSLVSETLNEVQENLKPGPESLSLTWIHKCFEMLLMTNKAFAKLMVDIDYPVSSWDATSIDEYLDYTITLLEILNSICSSLCRETHACVSLTHALGLMESSSDLAIQRMREEVEIKKPADSKKELLKASTTHHHAQRNGNGNGKERIFHEAMLIMKSIGCWVSGIVLSGLKSDVKLIMEITTDGSINSSMLALDSVFREKFMEDDGINVIEFKRVKESVHLIVSSGICEHKDGVELKKRLEVLANGLKALKQEEEALFGQLMAARNQVLQMLRTRNNC